MSDEKYNQLWASLENKIKILSEEVWEGHVNKSKINSWLDNFTGKHKPHKVERLHALSLVSQFMYFGKKQIEALLQALYRDLYRYPIIAELRKLNSDTTDQKIIEPLFQDTLIKTRFVSVGGASESGTHLLYYFRQQTNLPADIIISGDQLLHYNDNFTTHKYLKTPERYVFIDDFCGTGDQFADNIESVVQQLKATTPHLKFYYYPLFATSRALNKIRTAGFVDEVRCVMELDYSYECFHPKSRYFSDASELSTSREIFTQYGTVILPAAPLGYGGCQLLLGFHHNVPDNTLPIIWMDNEKWTGLFTRHNKYS